MVVCAAERPDVLSTARIGFAERMASAAPPAQRLLLDEVRLQARQWSAPLFMDFGWTHVQ